MLGGLFPSAPKRAAAEAFDPNDDLSAFAKAKKKKFRSKPSNITVVVLDKFKHNIPRGKRRDQLKTAGRVKVIQVQRNMSAKQVRNCIKQGFKTLPLTEWTYLNSSSYGLLSISEVQDLTGEDVVSKYAKGSLYVSEGEVPTENVRLFESRGSLL